MPSARSPAASSTASPRRRGPAPIREVRTRFPGCDDKMLAEATARFGVVAPFGGPTSSGMLTLHCPPAAVYDLASFMRERGAQSIIVAEIEYVFAPDNPLYLKLIAGL